MILMNQFVVHCDSTNRTRLHSGSGTFPEVLCTPCRAFGSVSVSDEVFRSSWRVCSDSVTDGAEGVKEVTAPLTLKYFRWRQSSIKHSPAPPSPSASSSKQVNSWRTGLKLVPVPDWSAFSLCLLLIYTYTLYEMRLVSVRRSLSEQETLITVTPEAAQHNHRERDPLFYFSSGSFSQTNQDE